MSVGCGRIVRVAPRCPFLARSAWQVLPLTPELLHRSPPRRALLYAPGDDEKKLFKAASLDVDCVIMDCEDGVAANRKDVARKTIQKLLGNMDFGRTDCAVRVNSMHSQLVEEDLKAILEGKVIPPTVLLPKVENVKQMNKFQDMFVSLLHGRKLERQVNLIIYVESAEGLLHLQEVCARGLEFGEAGGPLRLDGVVFGSDDFCASIGCTRTTEARELIYARQKLVVLGKAYHLQVIDMVHINYKDIDGLRQQSVEGFQMGFTGKQVIHPSQVVPVQESFTPSPDRLEWAEQLIQAFEEHHKSGKGAFTFRGSMIDRPLLRQAQNIVQISRAIKGNVIKDDVV